MITDRIPEVAQSRRLRHKLSDKVKETYSHVADEIEQQLLDALQERWTTATTTLPTTDFDTTWRSAA